MCRLSNNDNKYSVYVHKLTFDLLFVSRYHILKAETIKDIQFRFSYIFNNNLMHAFSNAKYRMHFHFSGRKCSNISVMHDRFHTWSHVV